MALEGEGSTLTASRAVTSNAHELSDITVPRPAAVAPSTAEHDDTTLADTKTGPSTHDKPSIPTIIIPPNDGGRKNSEAIGGATDLPTPLIYGQRDESAVGPKIQFVLLLASSTGTRHAYQIDERYLTKRDVIVKGDNGEFDPTMLKVYALKELILRDWRSDWETKPNSPSAIRLISFGQLLDDNATLKECKILANGEPKVLHLTVKPQDLVDKDEIGGSKNNKTKDGEMRDRGCCCVIL